MILDQRSDIEQFFLESLEQVKEEKRRHLEAEKIRSQPPNQGMMKFVSDKADEKITVELSDLDWEDRERILRLLFSKMNTGESAADWRETDEPVEEEVEEEGQSLREQEDEEDYGTEEQDPDANIFDATKIPDTYQGENQ